MQLEMGQILEISFDRVYFLIFLKKLKYKKNLEEMILVCVGGGAGGSEPTI
jgi:hypothetical protein